MPDPSASLDSQRAEIERLRIEIEQRQEESHRLDLQVATLSERVEKLSGEIERIKQSFGWRLLSRYGRIKYRYLLPLYRALGLGPDQSNANGAAVADRASIAQPDSSASLSDKESSHNSETEFSTETVVHASAALAQPEAPPAAPFQTNRRSHSGRCNICGRPTEFFYQDEALYRESLTCAHCLTTSRYRSIARGILRAINDLTGIRADSLTALKDTSFRKIVR